MFHLMQLASDVGDSDLESFFSLEDEQTPETILSIAYSDSKAEDYPPPTLEDASDLEYEPPHNEITEIYQAKIEEKLVLLPDKPSPIAKIQIFLDGYDKPIPVIAYFDTGATCTIINPDILPLSHWNPAIKPFE